jgi:hypothetical protein
MSRDPQESFHQSRGGPGRGVQVNPAWIERATYRRSSLDDVV